MGPVDRYTCEEVFGRLDEYLDRRLEPDELRRVREHLDTCAVCASEYKFEGSLLTELRGKIRRLSVPPDLLGKIGRAIADRQP